MSATRYYKLECDECETTFECWTVFQRAYSASEIRHKAAAYGWIFHSGKDVCPSCRKKAKSSRQKAESYETHKTKRRNRYRAKVGIPIDSPVKNKSK